MRGNQISGHVDVIKHDASMASVFGPLTTFRVDLAGTVSGDHASSKGTSPQAPGVPLTLNVRLLHAA